MIVRSRRSYVSAGVEALEDLFLCRLGDRCGSTPVSRVNIHASIR